MNIKRVYFLICLLIAIVVFTLIAIGVIFDIYEIIFITVSIAVIVALVEIVPSLFFDISISLLSRFADLFVSDIDRYDEDTLEGDKLNGPLSVQERNDEYIKRVGKK
jgi:hypothetical protein